jgi:glycosyltransferase involved in cell wall biosynthesis
VIPTHNRARFITAAIESVLAQTGVTWSYEIVVVDDGSTDDTENVLRPYEGAIRYYKIDHSGRPARARNVGIAEARGELVAFLDSDDLWTHDKLATQVPAFDDPEVVLSYGQARKFYGDDLTPREHIVDPVRLARGKNFRLLLQENVISTLTTVVRRAALVQVGGFNESPELPGVEDYELWLRLVAAFPNRIVSVPRVLALYRVHDGGLGSSDSLTAISRLLAVYGSVWRRDFLTREQRSALETQLARMHENWSRQQATDGNVPPVSVVMSIYRDRAYVAQAVQSILDQTFDDFELIVVDDGSDDGSYEIVAEFDDPRIRIVRQMNHGLVHALNTGIRLARAALVARQDADDISLPTRLEREVAWMSANPRCAVVGTFFRYVDERTLEPTGVTITSVTKHVDIVRHMYFDNPIGHGTALIRREAIMNAGGYSASYGPNEDFDLWRRIVAAGGGIALLPDVYYLYRLNPSSISSTTQELQHQLFGELLEEIWRGPVRSKSFWRIAADSRDYASLDSPFRSTVHRQYKDHQIRLTMEFLKRGHLRAAANSYLGALLIDPAAACRYTIGLALALTRAALRHAKPTAGGA